MSDVEYLGDVGYRIIDDYAEAAVGSKIRFEGVIDSKPVISNTPSKKPFKIMVVRYFVNTSFSVDGVKVKYEGPAFLRKGQKITLWGTKKEDHFEAVKIDCEDFIIQIY